MALRSTLSHALLVAAPLLLSTPPVHASLTATATVTATQTTANTYDYTIALHNTGDTTIGTFWFSWVPGAGFLSAVPSAVNSPAGWTEKQTNSGAGIQWTTSSSLLAANASLSGFEFFSTETPTLLASSFTTASGVTDPAAVFFVYQGAPLVGSGFQATANVVTPEPSSVWLALTGLLGVTGLCWKRGGIFSW